MVSEGEILALFVAQKVLAQYRGTPLCTRRFSHLVNAPLSYFWTSSPSQSIAGGCKEVVQT